MYSVIVKTQAVKYLQKLDQRTQKKIALKIDQLARDPFSSSVSAKRLQTIERGYRLRVGDIRIIYEMDTTSQTIIIWKISPRSSAYRP